MKVVRPAVGVIYSERFCGSDDGGMHKTHLYTYKANNTFQHVQRRRETEVQDGRCNITASRSRTSWWRAALVIQMINGLVSKRRFLPRLSKSRSHLPRHVGFFLECRVLRALRSSCDQCAEPSNHRRWKCHRLQCSTLTVTEPSLFIHTCRYGIRISGVSSIEDSCPATI